MVDFEKAAINSFENNFIAVISGCFFHLSQNIWRKIQSEGLAVQYQADSELQIKLRMLMGLAFVPEQDVPDCFISLMTEFPEEAITVAQYFEETYIGKRLHDQSRRVPQFPIIIWSMYQRVKEHLARTTNNVEGWHNAFQISIACSHPTICKLLKVLQREQLLQEAMLTKWEAGETRVHTKKEIERNKRIQALVSDYENRDTLTYLRGIAYNFSF